MLPEPLAADQRHFVALSDQPANRWDGFDLSAPDGRATALRGQICFAGCALAALAAHPAAGVDERDQALSALADLADRMIQRRVWAAWAAETERAGRKPDPVDGGYGAYSGELCLLLSLSAALGGPRRYDDDPFVLRWSADVRAEYTGGALAAALWRELRASPDGAVRCAGELATPSGMAALLLALRLHDRAYGSEYAAAGDAWLGTLSSRMAIGGPRLPGRGALAGSFNIDGRRPSFGGDALEDAWGLALTAALDRDLAARLAGRHWPALPRLRARGEALALAFSYLLAVELGDAARAAELQSAPEGASPWISALYTIGAAGGLGRLLAGPPSLPAAPPPAPDHHLSDA